MKTITKDFTVERSGNFVEHDFSIDSEDMPHIFGILRNQLYSDKILAVLRELSANAVDANVEANKAERPIHVTLPNRFETQLKVRDFGDGLTDSQIQNVYTKYGKSTKRNSNSTIGTLGVGCKSPWCITDSFVVVSYVGGRKSTWTAYISENNRGTIAKMTDELTDEESGLEVIVPVPANLVESFQRKAFDLYPYFKVKPTIKGCEVPSLERKEYLVSGAGWGVTNDQESVAIMGGIPYKMSAYSSEGLSKTGQALISLGVEIEFEIGDLQTSASRESLEYTEYTNKAIATRINAIVEELSKRANDDFKNCKSLFEAKTLYYKTFGTYGSWGYKISGVVSNKVKWNGQDISVAQIEFSANKEAISCRRFYTRGRSQIIKKSENRSLTCDGEKLYFNDLNTDFGLGQRANTLLVGEDKPEHFYLVGFSTPEGRATFEKETGLIVDELPKISSIPRTKRVRVAGAVGSVEWNEKHTCSVLRFVPEKAQDSYYRSRYSSSAKSKPIEAWAKEEIDEDEGGVYVKIDAYKTEYGDNGFERLKDILANLKKIGHEAKVLYGVKPSKIAELGAEWVELTDYVKGSVKEAIEANKQAVCDKLAAGKHTVVARDLTKYIDQLNKKGVLYDYWLSYDTMVGEVKTTQAITDAITELNGNLRSKYGYGGSTESQLTNLGKPSINLNELQKKVLETYPLLEIAYHGLSRDYNKPKIDRDKIFAYIEAIDTGKYKP